MLTSVIKGISLLIMYITLAQQVKKSTCNAGNVSLIAGLGRSPGGGNGKLLQYSCLGNPMDRGAWQATVYGNPRDRHNLATKPPTLV